MAGDSLPTKKDSELDMNRAHGYYETFIAASVPSYLHRTSATEDFPPRARRIMRPTLETAILDIVNDLTSTRARFSAFEVTMRLRMAVNGPFGPTIDTRETGTLTVLGKEVPRIEHRQIKELLFSLYRNNGMGQYTREHNGQYYEYVPANSSPLD